MKFKAAQFWTALFSVALIVTGAQADKKRQDSGCDDDKSGTCIDYSVAPTPNPTESASAFILGRPTRTNKGVSMDPPAPSSDNGLTFDGNSNNNCVQCPDMVPTCQANFCPFGTMCLTVQQTCFQCSYLVCAPSLKKPLPDTTSASPSALPSISPSSFRSPKAVNSSSISPSSSRSPSSAPSPSSTPTNCVFCVNSFPTCPSCPQGEVCVYTQMTCTSCPTATCASPADYIPQWGSGSGSSVSASNSSSSASSCVQCENSSPSCPSCSSSQVCVLQPQNCSTCAQSLCFEIESVGQIVPPNASPSGNVISSGNMSGGGSGGNTTMVTALTVVGAIGLAAVVAGALVFVFYIRERAESQQIAKLEQMGQAQGSFVTIQVPSSSNSES